ncbi:coiled-coil domain-containing protein 38 [Mantella aurantiaca]
MSDYILHLPHISKNRKDSETVREYIDQKRKLFREQIIISTKQDKIKEMKTTVANEKKNICTAEKAIVQAAFEFEQFLKTIERDAVEAMKTGNRETKARLKKEEEIQRARADIMAIKSDIVREEELLKEYKQNGKFLYMLSPPEWRKIQEQKRMDKKAAKKKEERRPSEFPPVHPKSLFEQDHKLKMSCRSEDVKQPRRIFSPRLSISGRRKPSIRCSTEVPVHEPVTKASDSEEELEIYFTDPQQLIQIIEQLEEDTIHLLEKLQEEEQNLAEITQKGNLIKEKMAQELKSAKEKKELLDATLAREKEITENLELKIKIFSVEDFNTEYQDEMISKLTKLIADLYTFCVGNIEATIDPLQMLLNIENNVAEVEEILETFPRDRLEAVRKKKEKEMRSRLREEKLKQQELVWESRIQRAMERAAADTTKPRGRKLMKRSEPPSMRQNLTVTDKKAVTVNEDLNYFFT